MRFLEKCLIGAILVGTLFPLLAQEDSLDLQIGFQTVDVEGDENLFRSQQNTDDGLLLRGLNYSRIDGTDSFFDRLRITATGFGAAPHGRFRVEGDKAGWFDLKLQYTRLEHFNALATINNPNPDELTLGQHTVDRVRENIHFDLELLPGQSFTPIIGYRRQNYDGPARSSWHIGQDEFQIDTDLDETEEEFLVGLAYTHEKINLRVTHGQRDFEGTETYSAGPDDGNNSRPVLGEDITLDDLNGRVRYESETPVTIATARIYAHPRVGVLLNYINADAEAETDHNALFTGNFASFRINRFFSGGAESFRSRTESPSWRGDARVNLTLPRSFSVDFGFGRRNLELDGNAVLETLFLDSLTFSGADPRDYTDLIDATTRLERDEDIADVTVTSRTIPHFRFWAGFSQHDAELTVDQDLAEIIVPVGQEGSFDRSDDRIRLGAAYRRNHHQVSIEHITYDADEIVMRTDYLDQNVTKLFFRSRMKDMLHVSSRLQWRDSENDSNGVDYELDLFRASIDLEWTPTKTLNLRASYSIFDLETSAQVGDPLFDPDLSHHREDGDDLGFGLNWVYKRCEVDAGFNRYDSDGVLDFTLDRVHLGAAWRFSDRLSFRLEGFRQEYQENLQLPYAYENDTVAFLLQWNR